MLAGGCRSRLPFALTILLDGADAGAGPGRAAMADGAASCSLDLKRLANRPRPLRGTAEVQPDL